MVIGTCSTWSARNSPGFSSTSTETTWNRPWLLAARPPMTLTKSPESGSREDHSTTTTG